MTYKVINIQTVEPHETQSLIIQNNQDLVTLVTCTPKHINTHRLLVTGQRIIESEKNVENIIEEKNNSNNIIIFINLLFLILFTLFIFYFKSHQNK